MARPALLVLEDGTTLRGTGFGAEGETFGEMVFNTGMTGYQETLTDPSYCRQIVAMTAPHIGNTGVNDEDPESRQVWVSGYVVREPARLASSWRATRDLDAYLRAEGVTGIAVRGTRLLTRRVRERGAMRAAISTVESDPGRAARAGARQPGDDRGRPGPGGEHARAVHGPGRGARPGTGWSPWTWASRRPRRGTWPPGAARSWSCPATATAEQILAASPDGVFFSNGPGDPAAATYAVDAMRGVLDAGVPVFGICLGSQILAQALGLGTYKLRYGHRGVNQPVMDLATGRVYITSHNHGFAAALPVRKARRGTAAFPRKRPDATTWSHVPARARQPFGTPYGPAVVTHVNLNDGVVEGLRLLERPVFSVQYHPEAAPGPHDAADHFDHFRALLEQARGEGASHAEA